MFRLAAEIFVETGVRRHHEGLLDIMGYRSMLKAFLACVRDAREPAMSLAVARRDMEVVFAAYRSLESGRFEPTSGRAPFA